MYSTQRLSGSEHHVDFMGPNIISHAQIEDGKRLTPAEMFRRAAAGHGQLRNQLLAPLENIQDRNVTAPGEWSNAAQRATATPDGLAFAAMDMPGVVKTDILAIMPGMGGTRADLLDAMRDIDILGQYDHFGSNACKVAMGETNYEDWLVDGNLPQEMPTRIVSKAEGGAVMLEQINERHKNQIGGQ
jgi:hypothetical protein